MAGSDKTVAAVGDAGKGKTAKVDRETVSACIITFNEEHNIEACLESVAWCDEIIVVEAALTADADGNGLPDEPFSTLEVDGDSRMISMVSSVVVLTSWLAS